MNENPREQRHNDNNDRRRERDRKFDDSEINYCRHGVKYGCRDCINNNNNNINNSRRDPRKECNYGKGVR